MCKKEAIKSVFILETFLFILFKVMEKLLQLHHHWLKNKRGFYFLNQLPSVLHQEPLQGNPANRLYYILKGERQVIFKNK